jgi:hypothetical protein
LRRYGEAIEADLAFRGVDLLDFYRGTMSARRLWALVSNLPPESATVVLSRAGEESAPQSGAEGRALAPVKCLEDIPLAPSLSEVGKFVNAGGDEFTEMAKRAG